MGFSRVQWEEINEIILNMLWLIVSYIKMSSRLFFLKGKLSQFSYFRRSFEFTSSTILIRQADGRTDGQMDGRTEWQTDGQTDGRTYKNNEGLTDVIHFIELR